MYLSFSFLFLLLPILAILHYYLKWGLPFITHWVSPSSNPCTIFSPFASSSHQNLGVVFERVRRVILLTIDGGGGGKVLWPVINLQGRENTPSLQGYSIETYSLLLRINEGPQHLFPSLYIIDTTP
jgi:hypothetical protein